MTYPWCMSKFREMSKVPPDISQDVNDVVISDRHPIDILNLKYKNKDLPEIGMS